MSSLGQIDKLKCQFEDFYEQEARLFVGKKSDYYIKKWGTAKESGKNLGMNWPGFLFSLFWLGYRKMYLNVFYFLCGFFVLDIAQYFIPIDIYRVVGTTTSMLIGVMGNLLYYKHMKKKNDSIKEQYNDITIERKIIDIGGASWVGVGISILMLLGYMCLTVGIDIVVFEF